MWTILHPLFIESNEGNIFCILLSWPVKRGRDENRGGLRLAKGYLERTCREKRGLINGAGWAFEFNKLISGLHTEIFG